MSDRVCVWPLDLCPPASPVSKKKHGGPHFVTAAGNRLLVVDSSPTTRRPPPVPPTRRVPFTDQSDSRDLRGESEREADQGPAEEAGRGRRCLETRPPGREREERRSWKVNVRPEIDFLTRVAQLRQTHRTQNKTSRFRKHKGAHCLRI